MPEEFATGGQVPSSSVIGIGDGPGVPCRLFAFDFARTGVESMVSGVRDGDGVFHLDRVSVPATAWPCDALRNLRFEFEGPTFPAGQTAAERVAAVIEHYGLAPAPPAAAEPAQMGDLDQTLREMDRSLEYSLFTARYGAWPDPVTTRAQPPDSGPYDGILATLSGAATAEPILASDLNWPAPERNATCAHVCGPDPGHVCDARAMIHLEHKLPSGGVRQLPLCVPCYDAETAALGVAS